MGRFQEALAGSRARRHRRGEAALAVSGRPAARRGPRSPRAELRGGRARQRSRSSSTSALRAPGTTCGPLGRPPRSRSWPKASSRRESTWRRQRQAAPTPSCSCSATWTTHRRASSCRSRASLASTRSSRRTTRKSSSAQPALGAAGDRAERARPRRPSRSTAVPSSSSSRRAPRDRVIVAESGVLHRAQGAAAELAGADAVLVGSALMRAPDPGGQARGPPAPPARQGLRAHPRGGRRRRPPRRAPTWPGFVLAESPRRAAAPLPSRTRCSPSASSSARPRTSEPTSCSSTRRRTATAARDGVLLRERRAVASVLDLPWLEEDDGHWERAAAVERPRAPRGRARPGERARGDRGRAAVGVDASRSLEASPGDQGSRAGARLRGGGPVTCEPARLYGAYGGRYVPETLVPGARRARARLERGRGRPGFRARARGAPATLRRAADAALPRRAARRRKAHLPQARGPLPHGRAQDQQRARPGARRAAARQAAHRRGDRRRASTASRRRRSARASGSSASSTWAPRTWRARRPTSSACTCSARRCSPVEFGTKTLKEATSEAIRDWITNVETTHYLIGSCVGPHPYPELVRELQAVIGREAREQILEAEGRLPGRGRRLRRRRLERDRASSPASSTTRTCA